MKNQNPVLYTVGHSVHGIDQFLDLLRLNQIRAVADVRSSPYSKFTPQFNREVLERTLKKSRIYYVFLGKELGARRDEPECYDGSKVSYRKVAQTTTFQDGLARLQGGASKMRVAIMCAEKDPLTCHRTVLVAHYSRHCFSGFRHILEDGSIETGDDADNRLLAEYDLAVDDLFSPREERLQIAYNKRAEKIAYEEKEQSSAYG